MKYLLSINQVEYDFLTRNWKGKNKEIYDIVKNWLGENKFIVRKLTGWYTTDKGKQAVKDFEEFYDKLA